MDLEDKIVAAIVCLVVLLAVVALTATGVWSWRNAEDKRACRRAGGMVIEMDHAEWHCVGATPEAR